MSDDSDDPLYQEAAEIFLLLRDDPDDKDLIRLKKAFLSGGRDAQDAYRRVETVFAGVQQNGRRRNAPKAIVIVGLATGVVASALAVDPLRIYMTADITTRKETQELRLSDTDIAILDAGTAIVDNSDGGARQFDLLRGTAFFDVEQTGTGFVVELGDLTVRTIGTAFETALLEDGLRVAVSEGAVSVSDGTQNWRLRAGEVLRKREGHMPERTAIEIDQVASWRMDRLVVDGMTLGEAADVLDRRLTGKVTVVGRRIRSLVVTGSFDMTNPEAALRGLALLGGAQVQSLGPLGYIIRP